MRFFTPISISKNQSKTPEGFLVCAGSAIARTGSQLYNETELAVPPGPDGMITVERDASQVFAPETIASAEGKDIVIDVIDNGIGLPKENRARLLEPYVTTREKGTGLGLAIVNRALEEHGGKLELRDAADKTPGARGAWMQLRFVAEPAKVADEAIGRRTAAE